MRLSCALIAGQPILRKPLFNELLVLSKEGIMILTEAHEQLLKLKDNKKPTQRIIMYKIYVDCMGCVVKSLIADWRI